MKINIASNEVIHFIGIGGIGMSGLAQIMKNMRKNYSNDVYSTIENQIKEFI